MDKYLDQKNLERIFNLISVTPGLPLSRIAEMLNMKISLTKHYLSYMEKEKQIYTQIEKGFTRYYIIKSKRLRDNRTQDIKKRIFALLIDQPGLHLSKIAEKLDMSAQLAEYHLISMQKNQLIIGEKDEGGHYKRYYLKDSSVGVRERKVVSLLRQEHLLRIVLLILKHPNIQHKELLTHLSVTSGTLSHHLKKLDEYDIIEVKTYGREKGYRVKNKKEIMWIIRKYVIDLMTGRFNETWQDLNIKLRI